jgi:hypothetical protein
MTRSDRGAATASIVLFPTHPVNGRNDVVATHGNAPGPDGKEGVDGSSPSEGFNDSLKWVFVTGVARAGDRGRAQAVCSDPLYVSRGAPTVSSASRHDHGQPRNIFQASRAPPAA